MLAHWRHSSLLDTQASRCPSSGGRSGDSVPEPTADVATLRDRRRRRPPLRLSSLDPPTRSRLPGSGDRRATRRHGRSRVPTADRPGGCKEVVMRFDEQVEAFRSRPLEGRYPYLWLDARLRRCATAAGWVRKSRRLGPREHGVDVSAARGANANRFREVGLALRGQRRLRFFAQGGV